MKLTPLVLFGLATTTLLALYACGDDSQVATCTGNDPNCGNASTKQDGAAANQDATSDPEDGATNSDGGGGEWKPPVLPKKSPACGKPRTTPKGETFTTASGRTFHVWAPSNYDPNKAYPVALTFHGLYATGPTFESWFKMEDFVGNEGLTVYPDASGNAWELNRKTDLAFFDDMMKMLGDTFCIDPSNVLGFGFSHGGIFMSTLGCKRAGYVKAIAVGDGSHGGDDVGCGRLPVLITHRTKDPDELIAWSYKNRDIWRSLNACSPQTTSVNPTLNCVAFQGCKAPGSLTFCEDTWFDPNWPADWNHTVREPYRAFTWQWFKALP